MRAGSYAALTRSPAVDRLGPQKATISYVPDRETPEVLVEKFYGASAVDVVLVGPLDPRCGALDFHRFHLIDGKVFQQPHRHDRLTPLEALLLRALYSSSIDWATEPIDSLVGLLKQDGDVDDAQAAVLEQLLEEERADRQ